MTMGKMLQSYYVLVDHITTKRYFIRGVESAEEAREKVAKGEYMEDEVEIVERRLRRPIALSWVIQLAPDQDIKVE